MEWCTFKRIMIPMSFYCFIFTRVANLVSSSDYVTCVGLSSERK